MKTFFASAALAVCVALAAPAFAQDHTHNPSAGHYEWRSVPQDGPRATGPARVRIWVPAKAQSHASCDCPMMGMSTAGAAKCVKDMHGMASPSAHRLAG